MVSALFVISLLLLGNPTRSEANSICDHNSGFSQEVVARWCGGGGDLNPAPKKARAKPSTGRPAPPAPEPEEEAVQPRPAPRPIPSAKAPPAQEKQDEEVSPEPEEQADSDDRGPTRIQETDRSPGPSRSCTANDKQRAIDLLRRGHPDGYNLVKKDLKQFRDNAWWTECSGGENFDNFVVALHETVHAVSSPEGEGGRENYPLVDGKQLKYINPAGFFAPHRANAEFPKDTFKDLYFTNKPNEHNSAQDFSILLDELNAYTHGLHAANVLHKHDKSHQWRAGAVALMSFVKAYVTKAGQGDATSVTWQRLNEEKNRRTIQALYFQAEKVVGESCRFPSDGQDRWYLAYLCKDKGASFERVLERAPRCFTECGAKPGSMRKPTR